MKKLIILLAVTMTGCASYSFEKTSTTETKYPDGRIVTVKNVCRSGIKSTREVKAGTFNINKDCALKGGAEKLGANDELIKLTGQIVSKLPAIPIPLP